MPLLSGRVYMRLTSMTPGAHALMALQHRHSSRSHRLRRSQSSPSCSSSSGAIRTSMKRTTASSTRGRAPSASPSWRTSATSFITESTRGSYALSPRCRCMSSPQSSWGFLSGVPVSRRTPDVARGSSTAPMTRSQWRKAASRSSSFLLSPGLPRSAPWH